MAMRCSIFAPQEVSNVSTNRSNRSNMGSLLAHAGRACALIAILACVEPNGPALAADQEGAERKPLAGVTTNCLDCGVVRSIREIRTEREALRPDVYVSSPQYRDTMP